MSFADYLREAAKQLESTIAKDEADRAAVLQDLTVAIIRLNGEVSDLIRRCKITEDALTAHGILSEEYCPNCCELYAVSPTTLTLCPHCGQPIAPPGDSCGETVL